MKRSFTPLARQASGVMCTDAATSRWNNVSSPRPAPQEDRHETCLLPHFPPAIPVFHPQYRMLFNSYYNTVGAKHPWPQRGLLTRPPLADVMRYRWHMDEAMHALIARLGGNDPVPHPARPYPPHLS